MQLNVGAVLEDIVGLVSNLDLGRVLANLLTKLDIGGVLNIVTDLVLDLGLNLNTVLTGLVNALPLSELVTFVNGALNRLTSVDIGGIVSGVLTTVMTSLNAVLSANVGMSGGLVADAGVGVTATPGTLRGGELLCVSRKTYQYVFIGSFVDSF